jgi:hypothetical protein
MSKKSVYCLANSRKEANEIVGRLTKANLSAHEISVLFPDGGDNAADKQQRKEAASEIAGAKAGAGGLVGGALGLIAGIGVLAIPGVGPFLAAGPIMAAFGGAAIGAAAGGITGALIGMGIPETEARHYEGRIVSGNVLISVHSENPGDLASARNIFKQTGAKDICTAGEAYAKGAPAGAMAGPMPV